MIPHRQLGKIIAYAQVLAPKTVLDRIPDFFLYLNPNPTGGTIPRWVIAKDIKMHMHRHGLIPIGYYQ